MLGQLRKPSELRASVDESAFVHDRVHDGMRSGSASAPVKRDEVRSLIAGAVARRRRDWDPLVRDEARRNHGDAESSRADDEPDSESSRKGLPRSSRRKSRNLGTNRRGLEPKNS